jgi:hypothetical protein
MGVSNKRTTRTSMRELTKAELDRVAGGKVPVVSENPGGNRPPGQQGDPKGNMDTFAENNGGNRPPGQQP